MSCSFYDKSKSRIYALYCDLVFSFLISWCEIYRSMRKKGNTRLYSKHLIGDIIPCKFYSVDLLQMKYRMTAFFYWYKGFRTVVQQIIHSMGFQNQKVCDSSFSPSTHTQTHTHCHLMCYHFLTFEEQENGVWGD